MKISISPQSVHGKRRYMVRWKPPGLKRLKKFFKTKTEAENHAEDLRHQQAVAGESWISLTAQERNEVMAVHDEAKKDGVSLRQALDFWRSDRRSTMPRKTVSEEYTGFMAEKGRERISKRTKAAYKSNLGRFAESYGFRQMRGIGRQDGLDFLKPFENSPRTFNSYLTSLKTFFGHAVKIGHLVSNPFTNITKIDERRMADLDKEPAILSYEQCKALLKATVEHDKRLAPYVALCLFAGLRPEREAANIVKTDIMERSDGTGTVVSEVLVRGLHAKDRQRRQISAHLTLVKWLKLGGDMPPRNLRRRWTNVRLKAGLIKEVGGKLVGWEQDCLRHTLASAWLALYGPESTVQQLGHGDYDMLFGHYRTLMSRETAEKIFSLTPQDVCGLPVRN